MPLLFLRVSCYTRFVQIRIQTQTTHGSWMLCLSSLFSTGGRAFEAFPGDENLLRKLKVPERRLKVKSVSMLRPNSEK